MSVAAKSTATGSCQDTQLCALNYSVYFTLRGSKNKIATSELCCPFYCITVPVLAFSCITDLVLPEWSSLLPSTSTTLLRQVR